METQCQYQNCSNTLDNKRKGAKYCCREHKTYATIYRARAKKPKKKIGRPTEYFRLRELSKEQIEKLKALSL